MAETTGGNCGTAVKSGPGEKYTAERFEDVDLRNGVIWPGSSNERGGVTGWRGKCGKSIGGGEPIAGILGIDVFPGETSTARSLTSLVELNVLPLDFVLPRDHNFSANDVARAMVVEDFFGETEGNDKVLPPCPNSELFSGERADEDSSEEISEDVE